MQTSFVNHSSAHLVERVRRAGGEAEEDLVGRERVDPLPADGFAGHQAVGAEADVVVQLLHGGLYLVRHAEEVGETGAVGEQGILLDDEDFQAVPVLTEHGAHLLFALIVPSLPGFVNKKDRSR